MVFPPSLSDWKTALASGVKIEMLLKNSMIPEADEESRPAEVQCSSPDDKKILENMQLIGLTDDPLHFRWSEPSLCHVGMQSQSNACLTSEFAVDIPVVSSSKILGPCLIGAPNLQAKNEVFEESQSNNTSSASPR